MLQKTQQRVDDAAGQLGELARSAAERNTAISTRLGDIDQQTKNLATELSELSAEERRRNEGTAERQGQLAQAVALLGKEATATREAVERLPLREVIEKLATAEQLHPLASKTDLDKLATKEAVDKLTISEAQHGKVVEEVLCAVERVEKELGGGLTKLDGVDKALTQAHQRVNDAATKLDALEKSAGALGAAVSMLDNLATKDALDKLTASEAQHGKVGDETLCAVQRIEKELGGGLTKLDGVDRALTQAHQRVNDAATELDELARAAAERHTKVVERLTELGQQGEATRAAQHTEVTKTLAALGSATGAIGSAVDRLATAEERRGARLAEVASDDDGFSYSGANCAAIVQAGSESCV